MNVQLDVGDVNFADFSSEKALDAWGKKQGWGYMLGTGPRGRVFWCTDLSTYFRSALGRADFGDGLFYGEDAGVELSPELAEQTRKVTEQRDDLCRKQFVREMKFQPADLTATGYAQTIRARGNDTAGRPLGMLEVGSDKQVQVRFNLCHEYPGCICYFPDGKKAECQNEHVIHWLDKDGAHREPSRLSYRRIRERVLEYLRQQEICP